MDWPDYQVTAKGLGANPENKIHTDEVARTLGFAGGLVGGTTVYSYMTCQLAEHLGEAWLGGAQTSVKFFKPAYIGDALTIRAVGGSGNGPEESTVVIARNGEGVELARLETHIPAAPPPLQPLAAMEGVPKPAEAEKPLVSWDGIVLNEPFWSLHWQPDEAENLAWCEGTADTLPAYGADKAPLHPGLILQAANNVFKERFLLPAWIHTASEITARSVMRVGQQIEVRAVPVEKMEKKGHQIVDLYVVMIADGEPAMEVRHKAIFKVREAD